MGARGVLWLELDKQYDTLFVNIPISVCAKPNPDSYTGAMTKIILSNVMTNYYGYMHIINHGKGYYSHKIVLRSYIKATLSYIWARKLNRGGYSYSRFFMILYFPTISFLCVFASHLFLSIRL